MTMWAYVDTDSGNHCGYDREASSRRQAVGRFRQIQLTTPDEDIFLIEYDERGYATKAWAWDDTAKRVRS